MKKIIAQILRGQDPTSPPNSDPAPPLRPRQVAGVGTNMDPLRKDVEEKEQSIDVCFQVVKNW
ncbi:hypothetical protein WG66_002509 [Moniliophthora roreri]|nr:hypothetical protein WG66_002509 [Moniliophthora roreri]